MFTIVLLSGCASKSNESKAGNYDVAYTTTAQTTSAGAYSKDMGLTESQSNLFSDDLDTNSALSNRKVILNAWVSLDVEDFNGAYTNIKTMIAPYGYVQETSIRKDKYYPSGSNEFIYITSGVIVIRVDADKFEQTMENLSGIGTIMDEKRGSDDITYNYVDTKARIVLLEDEKRRLEKYLTDETKDAQFIFQIQSRLTDVLYQIESYKGNIQKWDDMVSLSTITINMKETVPGEKPVKEYTYWDRLSKSFEKAVEFCGDILIFIISAIPVIVVLGTVTILIILIVRKLKKAGAKKTPVTTYMPDKKDERPINKD